MTINYQKQSGFTIVEFLIAVTILGILTSWAVPAFVGTIQTYRVDGIQKNFATSLKFAQSEAVKLNDNVVMCVASSSTIDTCDTTATNAWQQGWYVFRDEDGNNTIDNAGDVLRQQSAVDSIRFVANTNSLTFLGTGTSNTAGQFTICIDKTSNSTCGAEASEEYKTQFNTLLSGQFVKY